jgi:hypothetical protein
MKPVDENKQLTTPDGATFAVIESAPSASVVIDGRGRERFPATDRLERPMRHVGMVTCQSVLWSGRRATPQSTR